MFVKSIIIYFITSEVSSCKKLFNLGKELYALNIFILNSLDKNNLTENINL